MRAEKLVSVPRATQPVEAVEASPLPVAAMLGWTRAVRLAKPAKVARAVRQGSAGPGRLA